MQNGMTALMYASQHGHVAIVQTLLKESAKPNLTDKVTKILVICFLKIGAKRVLM